MATKTLADMSTAELDSLIEDYVEYCDGKRDIEEQPFSFSQWLAIELEARAEYAANERGRGV